MQLLVPIGKKRKKVQNSPKKADCTFRTRITYKHHRALELHSTLSMARGFISDYADTNSGDRKVVPESLGKQRLSSEVRIPTFKKSR